MQHLVIDNSNSRTKFAIGSEEGLMTWRHVMPTADISIESLTAVEFPEFHQVCVASVVPKKNSILVGHFRHHAPVHSLNHQSPLGICVDYPAPDTIGADRLANSVAAYARYGAPAIVVDFGTAVTFDVISAIPAYCGGVIAPGLAAMTGYLPDRTALLPAITLAEPESAIGKSTEAAMRAGAVFGYRGMIREIILKITEELGPARIVATGGDAALISQGLPEILHVDRDLTLEGILMVSRNLQSKHLRIGQAGRGNGA